MEGTINIRLKLFDAEAKKFVQLKEHLGLRNNSEVVRQVLQETYRRELNNEQD